MPLENVERIEKFVTKIVEIVSKSCGFDVNLKTFNKLKELNKIGGTELSRKNWSFY